MPSDSIKLAIAGLVMGWGPCLTYIFCIAERNVLAGIRYAAVFALGAVIAPVVLGAMMGLIPVKVLKSPKLFKAFQVVCGVVLIFFGFQLLYYVIEVLW